MPVFRKRDRIISFRVSQDEYEVLQRVSALQGAHSVSDYARWVACRIVDDDGHPPPPALLAQVGDLQDRVEELTRQVERLTQLVGR